MREGSDFVFESVNFLQYKLHRISLNRVGSYVDSHSWIRATINPNNKNNKCFRDSAIAGLNHKKLKIT